MASPYSKHTRATAFQTNVVELAGIGGKHRCYAQPEARSDNSRAEDSRTAVSGAHASGMRGFSLLELIVVIAILMIVAAITAEFVQKAAQTMRLQETAINYSNLLQQARLRAVHDDKYYTILTSTGGTNGTIAFVDIFGTGVYATGDPVMVFSTGVSPMSFASGPALSDLESKFLPNDPGSVQTVNTTAAGPSFGSRGLPCTPTVGPNGTCPYLSAGGGVPTSYITFLQNTQSGKWEAVTVTPAARIRQWQYDGTTWSSLD